MRHDGLVPSAGFVHMNEAISKRSLYELDYLRLNTMFHETHCIFSMIYQKGLVFRSFGPGRSPFGDAWSEVTM